MCSLLYNGLVPLASGFKALYVMHPGTYRGHEKAEESSYSAEVKEIALRILKQVRTESTGLREKIHEMLEDVPQRTEEAWIEQRLKVTAIMSKVYPVYTAGTDHDISGFQGRYYINIDPNIDQEATQALPWVIAHELSHILHNDMITLHIGKCLASYAATTVSTLAFGWGFFPASCAALAAGVVAHSMLSHFQETRADMFANTYTTSQEKMSAIAYLEKIKNLRKSSGISGWIEKYMGYRVYPTEETRIATIEKTFTLDQRKKKSLKLKIH